MSSDVPTEINSNHYQVVLKYIGHYYELNSQYSKVDLKTDITIDFKQNALKIHACVYFYRAKTLSCC